MLYSIRIFIFWHKSISLEGGSKLILRSKCWTGVYFIDFNRIKCKINFDGISTGDKTDERPSSILADGITFYLLSVLYDIITIY